MATFRIDESATDAVARTHMGAIQQLVGGLTGLTPRQPAVQSKKEAADDKRTYHRRLFDT